MAGDLIERSFWLAEVSAYGYAKPIDGPHDTREAVEETMYLFQRLGLERGRRFCCAEVLLTPIEAKPHGANEEALTTLNSIGLLPGASDHG